MPRLLFRLDELGWQRFARGYQYLIQPECTPMFATVQFGSEHNRRMSMRKGQRITYLKFIN